VSGLELSDRPVDIGPETPGGPARAAIAAAIVLHLLVAAWLLLDRIGKPAPEPPVIEVTLLRVPPPPAPPAPETKPLSPRSSGPGEHTTAAPAAPEKAPQPETPAAASETPPQPEPVTGAPEKPPEPAPSPTPSETARVVEPPPPPAPEKPQPQRAAARAEPRKEQLNLRAPRVQAPPENRTIGEKDETGDPFLNALWARIERNRPQTTPLGPSGLHLEGISVYDVLLDRRGVVESITLLRSSGSPELDDEAAQMIQRAAPFPPEYPERAMLKVTIRLFPQ